MVAIPLRPVEQENAEGLTTAIFKFRQAPAFMRQAEGWAVELIDGDGAVIDRVIYELDESNEGATIQFRLKPVEFTKTDLVASSGTSKSVPRKRDLTDAIIEVPSRDDILAEMKLRQTSLLGREKPKDVPYLMMRNQSDVWGDSRYFGDVMTPDRSLVNPPAVCVGDSLARTFKVDFVGVQPDLSHVHWRIKNGDAAISITPMSGSKEATVSVSGSGKDFFVVAEYKPPDKAALAIAWRVGRQETKVFDVKTVVLADDPPGGNACPLADDLTGDCAPRYTGDHNFVCNPAAFPRDDTGACRKPDVGRTNSAVALVVEEASRALEQCCIRLNALPVGWYRSSDYRSLPTRPQNIIWDFVRHQKAGAQREKFIELYVVDTIPTPSGFAWGFSEHEGHGVYIARNGTAEVTGHPFYDVVGTDVNKERRTAAHEIAHAFGAEHVYRGQFPEFHLMNDVKPGSADPVQPKEPRLLDYMDCRTAWQSDVWQQSTTKDFVWPE